jgi:hypothetical protein
VILKIVSSAKSIDLLNDFIFCPIIMEIDFTQSEIDTIKKHVDSRWREQKHGVHMGDIEVGGVEKPAVIWEDTYYTLPRVFLKIDFNGFF